MSTPDAITPPLQVFNARKAFGEVNALAGVSFALQAGQLVGLLGPNGAGKTTLIRAVAGGVTLDAGEVRLFGRPAIDGAARERLGVVPQELAVYPRLTARENLEVFGRLYGVRRAALRDRVAWALSWADLADRASEPTRRFSGGMKRRLNIACSLMHQPSVLLLDEPTVGVDPQSRERIYEMLDSLRREGMAIVLTTHHLDEAQQRCEQILIIDRGRIVASGTVADLVAGALGRTRALRVGLSGPLPGDSVVPAGSALSEDRTTLTVAVGDEDLDGVLARVAGLARIGGVTISDIALSRASLQDVFIALTGRELRE